MMNGDEEFKTKLNFGREDLSYKEKCWVMMQFTDTWKLQKQLH